MLEISVILFRKHLNDEYKNFLTIHIEAMYIRNSLENIQSRLALQTRKGANGKAP